MSSHLSLAPSEVLNSAIRNRALIWEMVKRDFVGRYKGSFIGVAWTFLNPLLLLTVYTVFFNVFLRARWGTTEDEGKVPFALVLFAGMIVHGFFAECLNRAPGVIVDQVNLVKKIVFPVEILAWVVVVTATLNFLVSLVLLVGFALAFGIEPTIAILLIPVLILPLGLMALGFTWLFASLGVFLRDVAQVMGFITTVLLFLSPVFYRVSALPPEYQKILPYNPLTLPIENLRNVVLWNKGVDWLNWWVSFCAAIAILYGGFWWFQKTRKAFADVI